MPNGSAVFRMPIVLLTAWLVASSSADVAAQAPPQDRPAPLSAMPDTLERSPTPVIVSASRGTQEVTNAGSMLNGFALDLYRRLASRPGDANLFFSPYSVYATLTMTAEGARDETADEMGRALHLPAALRRHGRDAAARPWDFAPVHAQLGQIAADLRRGAHVMPGVAARIDTLRKALAEANRDAWQALDPRDREAAMKLAPSLAAELNALLPQVDRYELRVANALWGDARYALAPEFVRVLAAHYGTGGVHAVDYRHDAEGARAHINAWVAEQTAQSIHDLLPPGSVSSSTRLVLTNAIWFKGEWAEVFDARSTRDAPFRLAGGTSAWVPLMENRLEGARYAAFRADGSLFPTPREIGDRTHDDPADPNLYPGAGGFQLAELPYKGGGLSMVIVLPRSPDGLAALERQLDAVRLGSWIGRLEPRQTHVLLPRFRLEQGCELRAPLETMGMVHAFVESAQFGGMSPSTNPGDALYVSTVMHRAFLEVTEKGTEAAAATGGVMEGGIRRTYPFVPTFRADRPFLLLIRDAPSGAILFMGRVTRP